METIAEQKDEKLRELLEETGEVVQVSGGGVRVFSSLSGRVVCLIVLVAGQGSLFKNHRILALPGASTEVAENRPWKAVFLHNRDCLFHA